MQTVRLKTGMSASGTLSQARFPGLGDPGKHDETWLCRLEDQHLSPKPSVYFLDLPSFTSTLGAPTNL